MKVIIITEGGAGAGIGHTTRCTSLYQAFEERGIKPYLLVNADESVKMRLQDLRCIFFDWLDEAERLIGLLSDVDVAIIDSYKASLQLYEEVSRVVKVTVYVDDTMRLDYPKGIVVNGSIYAESLSYPKRRDIVYLIGPQFIPLRREFWHVPDFSVRPDMKGIVVTFGGSDLRNLTPLVLRHLNTHYPSLKKYVVIGTCYSNTHEIESEADGLTELIKSPDARTVLDIMLKSDIAISAGGQTLYELARVGVPTIAVAVADNQHFNISGWLEVGFIEFAGWWHDANLLYQISKAVDLLRDASTRQRKRDIGRSFVDGQGARRVVECVLKYV